MQHEEAYGAEAGQRQPAAPQRDLLIDGYAEEDPSVIDVRVGVEQMHPDGADQRADFEKVSPLGALHSVDRGAESGGHEEYAEHQRAGGGLPLDPGGERERKQREQQDPGPGAEEYAGGERGVVAYPAPAVFEVGLKQEQQQAGDPGHEGHQHDEDPHLAEHVFGARERTREIEREAVVGEIGRDLTGDRKSTRLNSS